MKSHDGFSNGWRGADCSTKSLSGEGGGAIVGMNWHAGRRRIPMLGLAAWCCFGASAGILLYLLLHSGQQGIPGWQPVNESLRATLAISGEAASSPPPSLTGAAGSKPGDTSAVPGVPSADSPAAAPALTQAGADSPAATSAPAPSDASLGVSLMDLNAATAAELDGLPGIGPSKARAIVDFRDSRKGFRSVEELLEVKGIGPKLYDKLRVLVKVEIQAGSTARSATGTESS